MPTEYVPEGKFVCGGKRRVVKFVHRLEHTSSHFVSLLSAFNIDVPIKCGRCGWEKEEMPIQRRKMPTMMGPPCLRPNEEATVNPTVEEAL
jgi:hypothetical protein